MQDTRHGLTDDYLGQIASDLYKKLSDTQQFFLGRMDLDSLKSAIAQINTDLTALALTAAKTRAQEEADEQAAREDPEPKTSNGFYTLVDNEDGSIDVFF